MSVDLMTRDSHTCKFSSVTEDITAFTIHLTAQVAPWSDIAGTYDLDFGQVTPYQQTSQLKERGLGCVLTGDCDYSPSVMLTFLWRQN
jgi:hypothetical protein